jgi:hypothetical protein
MLYYHTDPKRQLIKERHEQLAHELRRARGPTPAGSSHRGTLGLVSCVRARIGRLRRGKAQFAPAQEA